MILYFLAFFYSLVALSILIFTILYILPFFFGAPFVRSSDKRTKAMMELLKPEKGEKIADLGSGDGKLLFEIARRGAFAFGFEVNPFLVIRTRIRAKQLGLDKKIKVYWKSFWNADLSNYDAVVLYQISYVMPRLEKKLKHELKPETRIVSNYFKFPDWNHKNKIGDVYRYLKSS